MLYTRRSNLGLSSTFGADKSIIGEILGAKIIILLILFIFPPFVDKEAMCIVITIAVSLEFWISKNLGRKFLQASWYVSTEGEEDEWVYQANLKSPTETYEAVFWYSFILYGFILIVMSILLIHDNKLSLLCAVFIGMVTNYINFYAFSQIIQMRNEGVLNKLAEQVCGAGVGETIKLPMRYRTKLGVIKQQNSQNSKN